MNQQIEQKVLGLIALDRLHMPVSSMEGKFKRRKEKFAEAIQLDKAGYRGQRVYARIEVEDKLKARGTKEGIEQFCGEYPKYGDILTKMIEDQRSDRETHLYFGTNPDCRLTSDDYLAVMVDLGLPEAQAKALYGPLMDFSRTLKKRRDENNRSIILG
jgi:hypothetical protein